MHDISILSHLLLQPENILAVQTIFFILSNSNVIVVYNGNNKVDLMVHILMDRGDLIPFNTIIVTDVQHRAKDEPLFCPNVVAGFELIHT